MWHKIRLKAKCIADSAVQMETAFTEFILIRV